MPAVITGKSRSGVMQALRQLEGGGATTRTADVHKKPGKVNTSARRVEENAGSVHIRAAKQEAEPPAPAVKKPTKRKEKR